MSSPEAPVHREPDAEEPLVPRLTPQDLRSPRWVAAHVGILVLAVAFALLGAIESLLSAVVADGMTGRRHRSNCELVAQGVANVASALFGGICVTGLIARTATNIRAGAYGPLAGMMHSVFLMLFMLIAAPLASYIPLAALAAVLAVVAWNMAEKHEFALLIRSSWGDATVLLATFLLTIFRDLTEGILVGFALGAVLFIHRMAQTTSIETTAPLVADDKPDDAGGDRKPYDAALATDPDIVVYRITGAFFFGAASSIGALLDEIAVRHQRHHNHCKLYSRYFRGYASLLLCYPRRGPWQVCVVYFYRQEQQWRDDLYEDGTLYHH